MNKTAPHIQNFFAFIKNREGKIPDLDKRIIKYPFIGFTKEEINSIDLEDKIYYLPEYVTEEEKINATLLTRLNHFKDYVTEEERRNLPIEYKITYFPEDLKPKDLKINDDLFFDDLPVTSLPSNLYVKGRLFLSKCRRISKLPDGLNVGELKIISTTIATLPRDIIIRGSLTLWDVGFFSSLPENLNIPGNLTIMGHSSLIRLPKGLKIGGNLNIEPYIISLPNDIQVGGDLISKYRRIGGFDIKEIKNICKGIKGNAIHKPSPNTIIA